MKVVILAGGKGMRLREETEGPKPLIDIGGRPLVWHIMNWYASFGYTDFVLALGYRADTISTYFEQHTPASWKVACVDTHDPEAELGTGGRLLKLRDHLTDQPFMVVYGDVLTNIDVAAFVEKFESSKNTGTMTIVRPRISFGVVEVDPEGLVTSFREKPSDLPLWSNGGLFAFRREIFEYIEGDDTMLEKEPLQTLIRDKALSAYVHEGFKLSIDTPKELTAARGLFELGAPWVPKEEQDTTRV